MILTRTPYRISFFGGGTDYPEWFRKEEGAVLSASINRYCYVSGRIYPPFFQDRHRVVWSLIETVNSIDEILHPAVKAGLRFLGFDDKSGIEIHHQGDLPARAGMGSSAAFAVGLLKCLLALQEKEIDAYTLAARAIELEQSVMKDVVGCQDQIAVSFGGINLIRFKTSGEWSVERLALKRERVRQLERNLLLVYLGTSRLSSELSSKTIASFEAKRDDLRAMLSLVAEGRKLLEGESELNHFGELLHETWMRKRSLAPGITSDEVDAVYEAARANGAIGGKLLGAGNTGFMLFYVPDEHQESLKLKRPPSMSATLCGSR